MKNHSEKKCKKHKKLKWAEKKQVKRIAKLEKQFAQLIQTSADQAKLAEDRRLQIESLKHLRDEDAKRINHYEHQLSVLIGLSSDTPREKVSNVDAPYVPKLEGYNTADLSRAKAQWFFGEWDTLAAHDLESLQNRPDRERFALLAASAHQQLGRHDQALQYAQKALEWGCAPRLVSQILIAGVHNTLGRIAALSKDEARTIQHFRHAVALAGSEDDADLVSHARSVREMAKLGLLPQAATLLDKELTKARQLSQRPEETKVRIRVLESEVELLHHELSIAQQRQQLFGNKSDKTKKSKRLSQDDPEWLNALRKKSFSQLGQDIWVLEQTNYKKKGFFVEFGATDGVLLSNTYLLEKEFGWRGICAEPNPKFLKQLKKNRNCHISNACIAGVSGKEVEFILADVYGGIADHANSDSHADKRQAYAVRGDHITLITTSLNDFLIQHKAPRSIDYLSIDTEGSEFEILSAFPFKKWKIKLLTVEHNYTPQRHQIRQLLQSYGYECIEQQFDDWYVLKNK